MVVFGQKKNKEETIVSPQGKNTFEGFQALL